MTTPRKQVHTESSANPATNKHVLRRRLLERRRSREPGESRRLAEAIAAVGLELPPLRRAECVALYTSAREEPGTDLLRAGLRRLGTRVLLPVVRPDEPGREPERRLEWVEDTGAPPSPGAFNLPEPPGPRLGPDELRTAAVVVVPALAVDTAGTRLGRGGGYYDRALAFASPDALVLALVHDDELFAADLSHAWTVPFDEDDARHEDEARQNGGQQGDGGRDRADAVLEARYATTPLGGGPLPREEHDVSVNGALTPSRWVLLRPAGKG